ncbi:hypothetical protein MCGE09_00041 [Thaumarchaeota archaeon SCGC AB-539-E09]|nr:hypothetical protein MCGE09_00041 [Thaumarchaeota archaeon SCGC AB-539-E09]
MAPIGFFVGRMAQIDHAERARNYHLMFRLLLLTSDNLHRPDREKCEEVREILKDHVKRIEAINGRTYNHTLQLRAKNASRFYLNGGRELKTRIYDVLWENGYISKADFNPFHDPSGGRKSGRR